MLYNLYQISSEDAAFVLLIKAEITLLLFNFDQTRVSGHSIEGSNLIKSDCFSSLVFVLASASKFESSPRKKCFNLLTLPFLIYSSQF